jgi:uncharacterized protein YcfL
MKKIVLLVIFALSLSGCSPKVVQHTVTEIEYRDRFVHDTATVEIPVEVERLVTRDTMSHLENSFAKSDAVVSQGLLSHSLESKPQIIKVPVKVKVTDTLWRESEKTAEIQYVEKQMTKFQQFRLDAFWWMSALIAGLSVWTFRKPLLKLIKSLA